MSLHIDVRVQKSEWFSTVMCPVCKHKIGWHLAGYETILCAECNTRECQIDRGNSSPCACDYYIDCIDEEGSTDGPFETRNINGRTKL